MLCSHDGDKVPYIDALNKDALPCVTSKSELSVYKAKEGWVLPSKETKYIDPELLTTYISMNHRRD